VLGFQGIAGQDYIGLDNISVTAVPEPSSLAMLFAGLAAVGSVVARRRINPS
jgi:PEP-CTERM motif